MKRTQLTLSRECVEEEANIVYASDNSVHIDADRQNLYLHLHTQDFDTMDNLDVYNGM